MELFTEVDLVALFFWVREHWILALVGTFILLRVIHKLFRLTRRVRWMVYRAQGGFVLFNVLYALWERISALLG